MPAPTDRLHAAIAAACPIVGVSVGRSADPASVRVDYSPGATAPQRAAAAAVVAAFDWSPAAQTTWEADRVPERKGLRDAAAQAVTDIDTYLGLASPTNAQVVAQVRRLSQITRAVVKRLIQLD